MKYILLVFTLFHARAWGADTLHLTLTRTNGKLLVSPVIHKCEGVLQITPDFPAGGNDMATLFLFRKGKKINNPATLITNGRFTFAEFSPVEQGADSAVLVVTIGGQAFPPMKILAGEGGGPFLISRADEGAPAGVEYLQPGNLVYDALRLSDTLHISGEEIKRRINFYLGRPETAMLSADGNAFLQEYIDRTRALVSAQGVTSPVGLRSFLSGVGGLDVTTLVDGLARFLVARTKQELLTNFFSRFQQEIAREDYKDLRILFPVTYQKLQAIGLEIYQFDLYKQALREAFASDLKNILIHLPEVVTDGRFAAWFDQHKEIRSIVLSGLYIYNSLADGKHPGEVIADYDPSLLDGIKEQVGITGAVQTVQQVSYALRSAGPGKYWTTTDSVKMVFGNPLARTAFMGLFWIRAAGVRYSNGNEQADSLRGVVNLIHEKGLVDSAKKFWLFFTGVIEQARMVESSLATLRQKKDLEGASVVYEDYYGFMDQCFRLLQNMSAGLQGLPYVRNVFGAGPKVDFYIRRVREINEIGLDVATANYHSAVVMLGSLYDSLTARALGDTFSGKNLADKKVILKDIIRYGIMMAGVVTAKSSDEVEKAIESVALPAGSSRIKRESIFNIALNAFVGPHAGHETIRHANNGPVLNAFGLSAPVGVAFSWGMHPVQKGNRVVGGKSNGVFLSLVDIGAVTTLRFGDTTTSRLPTVELRNIVAPGIYYSHGFGKCPLSLNLGVQYGPRLRDIKPGSAAVLDDGYWRVGLSLLMDIPLLNFYNKN